MSTQIQPLDYKARWYKMNYDPNCQYKIKLKANNSENESEEGDEQVYGKRMFSLHKLPHQFMSSRLLCWLRLNLYVVVFYYTVIDCILILSKFLLKCFSLVCFCFFTYFFTI